MLLHKIRKNRLGIGAPPAVISFHGIGSNMEDLHSISRYIPTNYMYISAQAPNFYPLGYGTESFAWYNIDWNSTSEIKYSTTEVDEAKEEVIQFVKDAIKEYGLDQKKIILLGFSQGAILSLGAALEYPNLIKGVIALSGYLLPQFRKNYDSNKVKKLNILMSHGTYDQVILVHKAMESAAFLKNIGIKNLTYKEYPIDHSINKDTLQKIKSWLNLLK